MNKCERCGHESIASIMSMFNTQQICVECKEKESNHPDYDRACAAEREALRKGDRYFRGIGLPSDLVAGSNK